MDTTTLRVLDTLARTIGESHSIRSLAEQVEVHHGTGHYPNVHEKLQGLASEGVVSFEQAGRSKVPRLHLQRTGIADTMATMELWRKHQLLSDRANAAEAIQRLEAELSAEEAVLSVCLVDAGRNLKLRRLEPLVLLRDQAQPMGAGNPGHADGRERIRASELHLTETLAGLEQRLSLRIDPWVVDVGTFGEHLRAGDANPSPRILRTETCLWHPQAFWRAIAGSLPHGGGLASETPARLAELEVPALAWNMGRWGYVERGRAVDEQATPICPEAVAIGALASRNPRWQAAAGVILSKADLKPTLLTYLAKANDLQGELAGLLQMLHNRRPDPRLSDTIKLLQARDVEPHPIEQDMVNQALESYGG